MYQNVNDFVVKSSMIRNVLGVLQSFKVDSNIIRSLQVIYKVTNDLLYYNSPWICSLKTQTLSSGTVSTKINLNTSNLYRFEERKWVLFVNDETLLSVNIHALSTAWIVLDVRAWSCHRDQMSTYRTGNPSSMLNSRKYTNISNRNHNVSNWSEECDDDKGVIRMKATMVTHYDDDCIMYRDRVRD